MTMAAKCAFWRIPKAKIVTIAPLLWLATSAAEDHHGESSFLSTPVGVSPSLFAGGEDHGGISGIFGGTGEGRFYAASTHPVEPTGGPFLSTPVGVSPSIFAGDENHGSGGVSGIFGGTGEGRFYPDMAANQDDTVGPDHEQTSVFRGPTDDEDETSSSSNNESSIGSRVDGESLFPSRPSCSAVPACAHLAGDCCPTSDGVLLDCCHNTAPRAATYRYDFTFYGHPTLDNRAVYLSSTGNHMELPLPSHDDDTDAPTVWAPIWYQRNVNYQYDLVYLRTDAIPDASAYVTGQRKFSLTLQDATTRRGAPPPPCTPVLLQLDVLPTAQADNYPVGRHSRYVATYTPGSRRLEFAFLDRPDPSLPHDTTTVNAIALLLDPGALVEQEWRWSFLDSNVACEEEDASSCRPTTSPVPPCRAGSSGCDGSCDNPACTTAPACAATYAESFLALGDRRSTAAAASSSGTRRSSSLSMWGVTLTGVALWWWCL